MKKTFTIYLPQWRTGGKKGGTGRGATALLNRANFQCCLGFICEQLGVPRKSLLGTGAPYDLNTKKVLPEWLVQPGMAGNGDFASLAMPINDEDMPLSERITKLRALAKARGIRLIFSKKNNPALAAKS